MNPIASLGRLLLDGVTPADVKARHRSEFPSFEDQMREITHRPSSTWRTASVDEALESPAIFGAVSLISNTVGSMSMEGYRRGDLLSQDETPRIIQRPNPFSTARDFFRDTAYYVATRGLSWWWVAVRDPLDNSPMSLYPVPPWEVQVERNDDNRLRPTIRWADRIIPNENMIPITYLPGRDGLGVGPLQRCGAAVSIAIEAQEWAANFFSGSLPSVVGTTEQDMTDAELSAMDAQWLEKPPGFPRWLTNGLSLDETPFDPEKAQLTEARNASVGDAARMFNMPGPLIEYQMGGSSLTYRNDETIWNDFLRRCLAPNYLEPIEQAMSDLLTRSTVARFNTKQLLRGSAKERAEVHKTYIEAGVYGPEVAAREEGYLPGAVDFAPVPPALPQAMPALLAADRPRLPSGLGRAALQDLRCAGCGALAGRIAGSAEIKCQRCGRMVTAA